MKYSCMFIKLLTILETIFRFLEVITTLLSYINTIMDLVALHYKLGSWR